MGPSASLASNPKACAACPPPEAAPATAEPVAPTTAPPARSAVPTTDDSSIPSKAVPTSVVKPHITAPCSAPPPLSSRPAERAATKPPQKRAMSGAMALQMPVPMLAARTLPGLLGFIDDSPSARPSEFSRSHRARATKAPPKMEPQLSL
ncbi:hypothetical protein MYXA107069_26320 [Myxococcus xanthus]